MDVHGVALVGLGESSEHALRLIEKIVHEAACPVIVLLHAPDPGFVKEASKRGVFAYVTDGEGTDWQGSIDIVLRRFAEYQDLEGAFGRRAATERARAAALAEAEAPIEAEPVTAPPAEAPAPVEHYDDLAAEEVIAMLAGKPRIGMKVKFGSGAIWITFALGGQR